jgi:hypothetical protein
MVAPSRQRRASLQSSGVWVTSMAEEPESGISSRRAPARHSQEHDVHLPEMRAPSSLTRSIDERPGPTRTGWTGAIGSNAGLAVAVVAIRALRPQLHLQLPRHRTDRRPAMAPRPRRRDLETPPSSDLETPRRKSATLAPAAGSLRRAIKRVLVSLLALLVLFVIWQFIWLSGHVSGHTQFPSLFCPWIGYCAGM